MKTPIFQRRKEVSGETRLEHERGYIEPNRVHYNVVHQVVRLGGVPIWKREIDREVVPAHVKIEVGALGGTGWRSRLNADPDIVWMTRRA